MVVMSQPPSRRMGTVGFARLGSLARFHAPISSLDAWVIGDKAFNDRDGVGQRLAGPGPGLPHDIAPFEQGRNARNLDGGGIDDLVGTQRVD